MAVRKITDERAGPSSVPLRVTTRRAHQRGKRRIQPRDLVRYGYSAEYLKVSLEEHPTGDPHIDLLEIGGVQGTLYQWRQYLLPLLGVPFPDEQKKEEALLRLAARRAANEGKKRIDNSSLPAGSSMYYYCGSCGDCVAVLPEAHRDRPPALCDDCQFLKDKGWIA